MLNIFARAEVNYTEFAQNYYKGRFVFIGVTPNNCQVMEMLGIEGRSEMSRNRVIVTDGERIASTEVADMSKVEDPEKDLENIVYRGMNNDGGIFVVSNGKQTDDILNFHDCSQDCLRRWEYEKDPSNTPRVSAVFSYLSPRFEFSILCRSRFGGEGCERGYWELDEIAPGYGFYLRTYECNGDPLPSYYGGPEALPLTSNDPEEVLSAYWDAMSHINRVSLVLKVIDIASNRSSILVKNRYEKVVA